MIMNTFVIDEDAIKKAWGAEGQYWFSFIDYSIVEDFNLMSYELPDGMSNEEFFRLKDVIPYLNVKRYQLAKAYVMSLDNKKIKSKFETLEENQIVEYFWKYFHVYPDIFNGFEKFQNDYIVSALKGWCDENKINYTVKL